MFIAPSRSAGPFLLSVSDSTTTPALAGGAGPFFPHPECPPAFVLFSPLVWILDGLVSASQSFFPPLACFSQKIAPPSWHCGRTLPPVVLKVTILYPPTICSNLCPLVFLSSTFVFYPFLPLGFSPNPLLELVFLPPPPVLPTDPPKKFFVNCLGSTLSGVFCTTLSLPPRVCIPLGSFHVELHVPFCPPLFWRLYSDFIVPLIRLYRGMFARRLAFFFLCVFFSHLPAFSTVLVRTLE